MRSCAGPAVAEARVGHHRALDSVTVSSARLSAPAASNTASGQLAIVLNDPDIERRGGRRFHAPAQLRRAEIAAWYFRPTLGPSDSSPSSASDLASESVESSGSFPALHSGAGREPLLVPVTERYKSPSSTALGIPFARWVGSAINRLEARLLQLRSAVKRWLKGGKRCYKKVASGELFRMYK
jgi:hypothetical protein